MSTKSENNVILEPYAVFYDKDMDVWSVKDTRDGMCYPMTGEPMSNEMSKLLNHYHKSLMQSNDELSRKDRKFEELGYNLSDLDVELGIG